MEIKEGKEKGKSKQTSKKQTKKNPSVKEINRER
jgi:hypothetical protein